MVVAAATNAAQHPQYTALSNKFFRDNHKSLRHLQVCFCLLAVSVLENLANQFLYPLFASYSFNHWSFVWQEMFFVIFGQQKRNLHVKSGVVPHNRRRVAFDHCSVSRKFAACCAWHLQRAARECWCDSSRVPQLEHELLPCTHDPHLHRWDVSARF